MDAIKWIEAEKRVEDFKKTMKRLDEMMKQIDHIMKNKNQSKEPIKYTEWGVL